MVVKRCSRCRQVLPESAFPPDSKMKTGLSSWCRPCGAERNRQWRAENRDYIDRANAARRVEPTPGVCVECGTPFVGRSHRILCSKRCKDRRARRLNPEKTKLRERNKNHSRRRRMQGTTVAPRLSNQDVAALLAAAKTCPLCQKSFLKRGLRRPELDHIVPLTIGGTHTVGNVRVICRGCNLGRPNDGSDVGQEALWARAV